VRRTLFLIISFVALAGLLSACGGDDSTSSGLSSSPGTNTDSNDDGHDGDMSDGHMDDDGRQHATNTPVAPGARSIELSGSSYAFDPPEITVRAGEDVAIVLTASDIAHDFTVDDLEAHVSAEAGETAEGGLRADEPGTYRYYCTVEGHREAGMEGTLIVEPA
jgi:plastocyanin